MFGWMIHNTGEGGEGEAEDLSQHKENLERMLVVQAGVH
jgi:hypothetical protein